ncbi:MAG: hypothetical protein AABY01_02740 [Nanoarchaeota archaeon]
MPANEVTAYAQRLKSAGYSPGQVRDALIGSGVSPVIAAKVAGTKRWVLWAAGSIAGAFVVVIILMVALSGPAFSLVTQTSFSEVKPGATLSFSDAFTFERDVGNRILLKHELVAPATGNIVASSQQVVTAVKSAKSTVLIPDDIPPGRYLVRTTAEADGHTVESSFSVKVSESKSVVEAYVPAMSGGSPVTSPGEPVTPLKCDDFDACTTDVIENNECVYKTVAVCCGDYICDGAGGETAGGCARDCAPLPTAKTSVEIIADAESEAADNLVHAEQLCATLAQVSDADQCYDTVARKAISSVTCTKIGVDKQRDSCLLYFAINQKEFSVCDQMTNPNLQSSCFSFRNLAGISQEASV